MPLPSNARQFRHFFLFSLSCLRGVENTEDKASLLYMCNRHLTSVANAPSGRDGERRVQQTPNLECCALSRRDREERADGHTHPRHPTRIRQPLTPSPHEPTTSASLGGSPPYLKANSRNVCYRSFFRGKYYFYG